MKAWLRTTFRKNKGVGPFVFFFCIGAFLRAYNFWVPDLWLDEYGTWWVVSAPTWTETAKRAIDFQGQSPFYFLIVKVFNTLFTEGAFQLRLPSVLFGILTLLVTLRLARQIFRDRDTVLASLAVFSINEPLIWFSQNARPYALALFLALLSISLYLDFLKSSRFLQGVLYAVPTALLIYAHFLFGFLILFQVLYAAIRFGWCSLLSKTWLLAFAWISLLCLPLSGQIIHLYARRQTLDWIPHIVQSIQASSLARSLADPWALIMSTAVLLIIGIKPINLRESPTREILGFLVSWLSIPLLGIGLVAKAIGVSFFEPRYILFVYPSGFFLWTWLLLHSKRTDRLRWLPLSVFLATTFAVSLAPNLAETGTFRHSEKLGWADAANTLMAEGRAGDLVIFYSAFIEADLFASRPNDTYLLSYVGWPLIAHLDSKHSFILASLPLLQDNRTDPYIESLVMQASKHARVWVVGPDQQREYFSDKLMAQFRFHPTYRYLSNNIVKVVLLVQTTTAP